MKRLFFILFCLALFCQPVSILAQNQVESPLGRFAVDYTKGCAPLTISFENRSSGAAQISYYLFYTKDKRVQTVPTNQTSASIAETGDVYLVQLAEGLDPVKDSLKIQVYTPTPPAFTVYACSNFGAVAEVQDRTYDFYEVSFGTAAPVIADAANNYTATYTFGAQDTYPVVVKGRYTNDPGNCGSLTKTISTRATLAPAQWLGLQWDSEASKVYLQYQLPPDIKYAVERMGASGTYERLFTLSSPSADTTINQPGLANQFFCYRLVALNVCDNAGAGSVATEPLCTASWTLSSVQGVNYVQYQTWSQFNGQVQLLTDAGTLVDEAQTSSGQLLQENVFCGTTYCYQLRLVPEASSATLVSISTAQCVVAMRSEPLPPLQNIASYWLENTLVVLPQFPQANLNNRLTLRTNSGQQLAAAQGDSLLYTTTQSANCYNLSYADNCGNAAPATPFCPLHLRNAANEPDHFAPEWNTYTGYSQGVQTYFLQELDETGNVLQEWAAGNNTSLTAFTELTTSDTGRRFRVKAVAAEAGVAPSYSSIFRYELVMKGYFPNAFSPNGDGMNDEFKILGKFVAEATLTIFNRWGEILFTSSDKEIGWTGEYSGKPLPPGPYVYKAEVTTADGQKTLKTGTVFLKR